MSTRIGKTKLAIAFAKKLGKGPVSGAGGGRDGYGVDGEKTPLWKYLLVLTLFLGGGLQVIIPLFVGLHLFSQSVVTLTVDNAPQLQKVFFGGDPWLLLCKNKTESMAQAFLEASYVTSASEFQFGVLDCNAPLPSGKNTYTRLGMKPPTGGRIHSFVMANGRRTPILVSPSYYQWNDTARAGASMREWILKQITPHYKLVGYEKEWYTNCLKHSHSALVLAGGGSSMDDNAKETTQKLMEAYRLLPFCVLNVHRYQVNILKNLPPLESGVDKWPRIVFFHKLNESVTIDEIAVDGVKQYWAVRAHRSYYDQSSASAFLTKAVSDSDHVTPQSPSDFLIINKIPTLTYTPPSSSSTTSPSSSSSSKKSKSSSPTSKTATDKEKKKESTVKKTKEEKEKERESAEQEKERQKKRRNQMDQETQDQNPQARDPTAPSDTDQETEAAEFIDLDLQEEDEVLQEVLNEDILKEE